MQERRAKGSGTLYKRGTKWVARWVVHGKVFKRSTGTSVKAVAWKMLDQFTEPFRAKTDAERIERMILKLNSEETRLSHANDFLLERVMDDYKASPKRHDCAASTFQRYIAHWESFRAFLAQNRPDITHISGVDESAVAGYLSSIRDLSPNAYNKQVTLFRSIWSVLSCESNPWKDVKKRTLDTQKHRALTFDELTRVFSSCEGETRCLFMLGLFTGLRLGDCVSLRWDSVDFLHGFISIRPSKTSKTAKTEVEIPLFPELLKTISAIEKKSEYILPESIAWFRRDRTGFHRQVITRTFTKAGIETTVEAENGRKRTLVGFHSLRHTFVTLCALRGVPLPVVQAIVGHTSIGMTEYYAHSNREVAMKELTRVFSSPTLQ